MNEIRSTVFLTKPNKKKKKKLPAHTARCERIFQRMETAKKKKYKRIKTPEMNKATAKAKAKAKIQNV